MTKIQVYRASLATTDVASKIRIYRASLATTSVVSLAPIPAQTDVAPQTTVNLTAVTAAGGSTPTSYTWRQISGPPVTITPDATTPSVATFTSPSVFPDPPGTTTPNLGLIRIGVTGTLSGVTSAEVVAQVTVLPQTSWTRVYPNTTWDGAKPQ